MTKTLARLPSSPAAHAASAPPAPADEGANVAISYVASPDKPEAVAQERL